jgi:hypothetical protein
MCVEPRAERVIEPLTQAGAAMLFGVNGKSLAEPADANHAEIKQVVVSGFEPPRHAQIRLDAGQL